MSDNISDDSNTEAGPAEWFETYSVLHPDDPNYRSPINNPPDLCSSSSTSPARSDASLPALEEHPVPYTATYFALQVYEVAYGILDYAHITWGFNGRNRFAERNWLAQAARVCKSFMNPALDMLWWELDDLGPLLRLLPDVEHTKVGFYPVKTIFFMRHSRIHRSNLSRFRTYARRVRHISYAHMPDAEGISISHIITSLAKASKEKPLFPGLISLEWRKATPSDENLALQLVPPCLRDIQLSYYIDYVDDSLEHDLRVCLDEFFRQLSAKATELQTITLDIPKESVMFRSRRAIRDEPRTILLGPQTLQALSSFASLTELTLSLALKKTLGSSTFTFPKLTHLRFDGPLFEVHRLLHVMVIPSLISFELVQKELHANLDYENGLRSLYTLLGPGIREIKLEVHAPFRRAVKSLVDIASPLLDIHDLHSVHLDINIWMLTLSDEDIRTFARAWPSLQHLGLCGEAFVECPSRKSLFDVATFFPHLTTLRLPMISVPDAQPFYEAQQLSPHKLKILNLVCGPLHTASVVLSEEAVSELAHTLCVLFPDLDLQSCHDRVRFDDWTRVLLEMSNLTGQSQDFLM